MTAGLWDREIFVDKLREIGGCAYHDKHPFHRAMNEGRLSPEAVRGWVANRFYYQRSIPVKDAATLSNCSLPEVRRIWIHRISDHDGVLPRAVESAVLSGQAQSRTGRKFVEDNEHYSTEGGIEAWLRLGEACGLSRAELMQDKNLQPGVRFAVDAYVNFARTRFVRFSSNAMCSGPGSTQFSVLMRTSRRAVSKPPRHGKFRRLESRRSLFKRMTMIPDHTQPRLADGVRLEIDGTTGKGVLLFPEGIIELNETAQEIVTRCDGRPLSEIVLGLAREYDADLEMLAADVRETLADLQRRKLVKLA